MYFFNEIFRFSSPKQSDTRSNRSRLNGAFRLYKYIILYRYVFLTFRPGFTDFKKENGFHGMPSAYADKPASPYNIPVLGQEDAIHRDDRSSGNGYVAPNSYFDGADDGKYDLGGGEGLDELAMAPIFDIDDTGNFNDGDDGTFDFAMSPFKYHRDVSSGGPKGDPLGYDDEVKSSCTRTYMVAHEAYRKPRLGPLGVYL